MFDDFYRAINAFMKKQDWYIDVSMHTGGNSLPWFTSLGGFWPGLQVRSLPPRTLRPHRRLPPAVPSAPSMLPLLPSASVHPAAFTPVPPVLGPRRLPSDPSLPLRELPARPPSSRRLQRAATLQVLYGDIAAAERTMMTFQSIWRKFGFAPEAFDLSKGLIVDRLHGYFLRPEMAESVMCVSTRVAWRATQQPTA